MSDLPSKLSLNEFLRIFIPGLYISILFDFVIMQSFETIPFISFSDSYFAIIFIIFSLVCGLLLSSLDIPKRFCFFSRNIPINQIYSKSELRSEGVKIKNAYFNFYDAKVSSEFKYKTETDSGFYHLCMNMAVVSLLFGTISACCNGIFDPKTLFLIGCFLLTLLTSLLILFLKVKNNFQRQTEMFRESEFFIKLNDQTTSST